METTFHALHQGPAPLLLPNAWDFTSGALLADAGFAAVGTTSLGVAAAAGIPDATGGTRAETLALARSLVRLPVPVTVDVENGFSEDPAEVAALAAELASYGVAGINLEDGRADGSLTGLDHQVKVLEAVREAAPGLFVNARTDEFWSGGGDLGETVRRGRAFADAGADGFFAPGIAADADVEAVVASVPLPLNVLHLPGRTAAERLAGLGVRRVSTGSLLYRAAMREAVNTALALAARPTRETPTYTEIQGLL